MTFSIRRGTNISEWLSQSERRGLERATFFTEADVRLIARLGFDHIRLPIDEEQMWDEQGRRDLEAFALLDAALDWCESCGLRAVVDLHLLRTHNFISAVTPRLFTDPAETARFAGLWAELSDHLCRRSTGQVAYELMNEAVATDPADWNRVAMAGFEAIRRREPERTVVLGSNHWNQTHTFDALEVPRDDTPDPHLPLLPPDADHPLQGRLVGGRFLGRAGPLPGPTHRRRRYALSQPGLPGAHTAVEQRGVGPRAHRAGPGSSRCRVARRTGHPLYCGEWGAYHTTPAAAAPGLVPGYAGNIHEA